MKYNRWMGSWAVLGMSVLPAMVVAQNPASEAQNKLLAKRAAEVDCYRKLAEAVYGMQISSSTFVKDFVAESDVIKSGVDAFIKGIRLGTPRYWEDGACEIDGEVTVEKLVTQLKQLHTESYKGNVVKTTDFEQMKQFIKQDIIKATGTGAPRPELPPDLPMGIESVITPLPQGYTAPPMSVPGIWRTVPPQARLMAERAARLDAVRKLLEQIKGLRLTSDTLVRDFVTESDEIRTEASGIVQGAYQTGTYLHNDELIVEVTMAVDVEKVIEKIKELHSQHYHGNKVTTTDIVNVKKVIQRDKIEATGAGVPPSKFIQESTPPAGIAPSPTWLGETFKATGQCARDTSMPEAQGKLNAERCARVDAYRALGEQILGVQVQSGTTVKDFVAQNDQILAQMQGVIRGAAADDAQWEGDIVKVGVTIQAAEIWSVVNSQLRINAHRK